MEIAYELRKSDIVALMRYRLSLSRGRRNPVLVRRLGYFIGFTLMGLGSALLLHDAVVSITLLVLGVFSFAFYPRFFNWLIQRKVSTTYREPKNRATLASRVLRATDEGIQEGSGMGEIKVKWDGVDNVAVTSSHAFITIHGIPSIVIPIDRVEKGNCQEFLETCRGYIKGKTT